jgi:hypothetical protein
MRNTKINLKIWENNLNRAPQHLKEELKAERVIRDDNISKTSRELKKSNIEEKEKRKLNVYNFTEIYKK